MININKSRPNFKVKSKCSNFKKCSRSFNLISNKEEKMISQMSLKIKLRTVCFKKLNRWVSSKQQMMALTMHRHLKRLKSISRKTNQKETKLIKMGQNIKIQTKITYQTMKNFTIKLSMMKETKLCGRSPKQSSVNGSPCSSLTTFPVIQNETGCIMEYHLPSRQISTRTFLPR